MPYRHSGDQANRSASRGDDQRPAVGPYLHYTITGCRCLQVNIHWHPLLMRPARVAVPTHSAVTQEHEHTARFHIQHAFARQIWWLGAGVCADLGRQHGQGQTVQFPVGWLTWVRMLAVLTVLTRLAHWRRRLLQVVHVLVATLHFNVAVARAARTRRRGVAVARTSAFVAS